MDHRSDLVFLADLRPGGSLPPPALLQVPVCAGPLGGAFSLPTATSLAEIREYQQRCGVEIVKRYRAGAGPSPASGRCHLPRVPEIPERMRTPSA